MISGLFLITTIVVAILASFGHLSIWWAVIPAFVAGACSLTTGRYGARADKGSRRDAFTRRLAVCVGTPLALAIAVYGITLALG